MRCDPIRGGLEEVADDVGSRDEKLVESPGLEAARIPVLELSASEMNLDHPSSCASALLGTVINPCKSLRHDPFQRRSGNGFV